MPRSGTPGDYVVDADLGSSTAAMKRARPIGTEEHDVRLDQRAGLRDLDAMVESMPGLNRMQRDRERLMPRSTTAELGDPRMQRRLPDAGEVRRPASARQRNARSKARSRVQQAMPLTQLGAQYQLVSEPQRWAEVNDQLSAATGDVQSLAPADQEQVRRIDRSIQSYERANDRGHVLYSNVQMPWYINGSNRDGFLSNNFKAGQRVEFDRYTAATHQLHETASLVDDAESRVAVFELQTRRGAYLGQSDKRDNTRHLLPRGLQFEVVGVHEAPYVDPYGRQGTRRVVQLRDVTPEN